MLSRLILAGIFGCLSLSVTVSVQAKETPSPVALVMKHKPTQVNSRSERSLKKLDLTLTKAECENIERSLTEAYGPATRTRGSLRIWEVSNEHKSSDQSKYVTVIAGQEAGRYFVKLDRQDFAVSNNPRLRKNRRTHSINRPKNKSKPNSSKTTIKSYERD